MSGHAYTVVPIQGIDNVFLGSDDAGHPSLFVTATALSSDPPLRTTQISLQLGQEYNVSLSGEGIKKQLLHAMRCESSDKGDVESFLALVEGFIARFQGEQIDGEKLSVFFRSLVKLFSVTQARDLQTARQGLWGELFIMRSILGFHFWVAFWHSEVTRLFDFSDDDKRVEVKTALGQQRIHHFSHRQIYAIGGEDIVIASVLVREEDAGLSLRNLIEECREALLGTNEFLKLERAVRQAGMESSDVIGPIFDAVQAEASICFYKSTDTPHFRMPEPPGVTDTKYRVDLSTAPALSREGFLQWLYTWGLSVPLTTIQRTSPN